MKAASTGVPIDQTCTNTWKAFLFVCAYVEKVILFDDLLNSPCCVTLSLNFISCLTCFATEMSLISLVLSSFYVEAISILPFVLFDFKFLLCQCPVLYDCR